MNVVVVAMELMLPTPVESAHSYICHMPSTTPPNMVKVCLARATKLVHVATCENKLPAKHLSSSVTTTGECDN